MAVKAKKTTPKTIKAPPKSWAEPKKKEKEKMIIKWYYHGDYVCTTDNASVSDAIDQQIIDTPATDAAIEILHYDNEVYEECKHELPKSVQKKMDERFAGGAEVVILIISQPTQKSMVQYTVAQETKDLENALTAAGWKWETHNTPEHFGGRRITQNKENTK